MAVPDDNVIPAVSPLNGVTWGVTKIEPSGVYSATVSRDITVTVPAGLGPAQTLSQPVTLVITKIGSHDSQKLDIQSSAPVVFNWISGDMYYTLDVNSDQWVTQSLFAPATLTSTIEGDWLLSSIDVPEPTMLISNALMLLPFGMRWFLRKRAA